MEHVFGDRNRWPAGSSGRICYERARAGYWGASPEPSSAPAALAVFPYENFMPLRYIAERTNNIVQWTSSAAAAVSPLWKHRTSWLPT